jgi:hypothetical protein
VTKLELALELGGSVAVVDDQLECVRVVGGEEGQRGGADWSRAVHVPRGERLCGEQVEVLAVVADAVVERSLEVELETAFIESRNPNRPLWYCRRGCA